ncbi:indole-3-acetic acid-induced protein ARG7-like [Miscanthus floridulus]|uniref:indole-3-acetic acid-induced protein ARG7-like n=1 Tax=Miscanthus floridulus TaxID=154761 RepID=UPI00345B01E5
MLRRSRHGGVRLGRKLLGLWRWALCGRRRRRGGYRRLQQQPSTPERAARKLAPVLRWGRSLARRLRLLGWRAGGHRMLGDGREQVVTTPKGQVAVYVGGGGEASQSLRYVVPVVYFNHPMFGELLREAEEEFGFQHPGVITIPCPAARFEQAAALAAAGKKGFGRW